MFTVAPDAMQLGAGSEISFEVVYFWNDLKGESHSMRNILTQTMQMDGAVKESGPACKHLLCRPETQK